MTTKTYELEINFVEELCKKTAYYNVMEKYPLNIPDCTDEENQKRLESLIDHEYLKLKEIFYKNIVK